jgi:hypothetical protein
MFTYYKQEPVTAKVVILISEIIFLALRYTKHRPVLNKASWRSGGVAPCILNLGT